MIYFRIYVIRTSCKNNAVFMMFFYVRQCLFTFFADIISCIGKFSPSF